MPTSGLQAGALDERITIQRPTSSPADEISGWTQFASCWARVEPFAGPSERRTNIEQALSGRDVTVQWVQFEIRRRTDINTTMRVTWRDNEYDIRGVSPATRLDSIFLTCRSVE